MTMVEETLSLTSPKVEKKSPLSAVERLRLSVKSLGVLPFLAFVAAFLFLPIVANVISSFKSADGTFTLDTMKEAMNSQMRSSFLLTFNLSVVTALVGGVCGLILAWALTNGQGPRWIRSVINSFSALASQSGGVQLAYAFIALLGTQGLMTSAIRDFAPGLMDSFTLTSFSGVALVYTYFQIPLMTILIIPAMSGLKSEWRTAAESLGATRTQYVRDVALPILWPPIAGAMLLLFANAFSAYATAYALASGSLNLVPIQIGFYISGNVLLDPGMAAALVTWMMIIIIAAMGLRLLLIRRSTQWLSN